MTADLSALIARLEAAHATGIIMESEAMALCNALGLEAVELDDEGCEHRWKQCCWNALKGSLDAALALAERVLDGWPCWGVATDIPDRFGAVLAKSNRDEGVTGYASAPALALCIALLRVKQGEGE